MSDEHPPPPELDLTATTVQVADEPPPPAQVDLLEPRLLELLKEAGLGNCLHGFQPAGVLTTAQLTQLTMDHYESIGITEMADRRHLFELVQRLKREEREAERRRQAAEEARRAALMPPVEPELAKKLEAADLGHLIIHMQLASVITAAKLVSIRPVDYPALGAVSDEDQDKLREFVSALKAELAEKKARDDAALAARATAEAEAEEQRRHEEEAEQARKAEEDRKAREAVAAEEEERRQAELAAQKHAAEQAEKEAAERRAREAEAERQREEAERRAKEDEATRKQREEDEARREAELAAAAREREEAAAREAEAEKERQAALGEEMRAHQREERARSEDTEHKAREEVAAEEKAGFRDVVEAERSDLSRIEQHAMSKAELLAHLKEELAHTEASEKTERHEVTVNQARDRAALATEHKSEVLVLHEKTTRSTMAEKEHAEFTAVFSEFILLDCEKREAHARKTLTTKEVAAFKALGTASGAFAIETASDNTRSELESKQEATMAKIHAKADRSLLYVHAAEGATALEAEAAAELHELMRHGEVDRFEVHELRARAKLERHEERNFMAIAYSEYFERLIRDESEARAAFEDYAVTTLTPTELSSIPAMFFRHIHDRLMFEHDRNTSIAGLKDEQVCEGLEIHLSERRYILAKRRTTAAARRDELADLPDLEGIMTRVADQDSDIIELTQRADMRQLSIDTLTPVEDRCYMLAARLHRLENYCVRGADWIDNTFAKDVEAEIVKHRTELEHDILDRMLYMQDTRAIQQNALLELKSQIHENRGCLTRGHVRVERHEERGFERVQIKQRGFTRSSVEREDPRTDTETQLLMIKNDDTTDELRTLREEVNALTARKIQLQKDMKKTKRDLAADVAVLQAQRHKLEAEIARHKRKAHELEISNGTLCSAIEFLMTALRMLNGKGAASGQIAGALPADRRRNFETMSQKSGYSSQGYSVGW